MKKLACAAIVSVGLSWALFASTWTIYHENHIPVKDGEEIQGSGLMTGVEQITNALTQAARLDTIVIKPGVYDLSVLKPIAVDGYAYCYLCTRGAAGDVTQVALIIKGECEKPWREKTPEEETILRGNDAATIFYAHGSGGRPSSLFNLTFEHGRRVSGYGDLGGGAISWAATEGFNIENMRGLASNCVFRSCSSAGNGGGTYGPHVFDSLYTNCTAAVGGGGAYGFCNNNNGKNFYTNTFDRCVFADCTAPNGGAIYAREMSSLLGCTFAGCKATSGLGGAVYVNEPLELAACCTFTNCTSTGDAGAMKVAGDINCMSNCTFVSCRTTSDTSGNGGAVNTRNNAKKDVFGTIVGCVFSDCKSGWAGGAIFADNIGAVDGCTFLRNRSGNTGGAIYSANSIASVSSSVYVGNASVTAQGGAMFANANIGTVTQSTFSGNKAGLYGGAGVYSGSQSGVYDNCTFHSNTNNETAFGAHVNNAREMVGCRFSGYGDIVAKSYDRCSFSNCVYQYTDRDYGADCHGLISYPKAVGGGTFRNCLVQDCRCSRILATGGVRVDVANCTFVNNCVDDNPPEGKNTQAIMFFAFRDSGIPGSNVFVNCIFADNRVRGQNDEGWCDADFSGSANPVGYTSVSHCLYKNGNSVSTRPGHGKTDLVDVVQGNPSFVAGNTLYPNSPYYMINRRSAARKRGVRQAWMEGATDLNGTGYPTDGDIDLGAYQCNLPPLGLFMVVR
ncbi:MAG: hypothetical protein KBT68_02200 [bacterium]|nr:hypothetical protein [Candidatus Colisoma equi]